MTGCKLTRQKVLHEHVNKSLIIVNLLNKIGYKVKYSMLTPIP